MYKFQAILLSRFFSSFLPSFMSTSSTNGRLFGVSGFFVFGSGVLAARALSMIAQIYLGREFGPYLYGQFTLMLLLANYFYMPMTNGWGLAYVRLASIESAWDKKLECLKAVLVVSAVSSAATLVLLTMFAHPICRLLDIDETLFGPILTLTVASSMWFLAKLIAQGLQYWRTYILIEVGWAVFVFGSVVGLTVFGRLDLHHVAIGFALGYILASLLPIKVVVQSLMHRMNCCYLREIFVHGGLLLINALITVGASSIDRLVIHYSLGSAQVGIYQAHFFATYGIVSTLITVFANYMFPRFCADHDLSLAFSVRHICLYAYPIVLIFTFSIGIIILSFYDYPLSIPLFVLLCIFMPFNFHLQIKSWYLTGQGVSTTRYVLNSQIIFAIGNFFILSSLVRSYGINAGGISLLVSTITALTYLLIVERRWIRKRTMLEPCYLHEK